MFPNLQLNLLNTSLLTQLLSPLVCVCVVASSRVTRLSAYGPLPQGTKLLFFLGKAPTLLEFSLRLRLPERDQRRVKCRRGLNYLLDVFIFFSSNRLMVKSQMCVEVVAEAPHADTYSLWDAVTVDANLVCHK